MITEIRAQDGARDLFALLIDIEESSGGTVPVTDPSWSLQLLVMNRTKGHVVRKHMHKKLSKSSSQPMEAMGVVRGEIQVNIFDRKGVLLAKQAVRAGQKYSPVSRHGRRP